MDRGQTENGTLTEQEPTGLLAGAGSEETAGEDPNKGVFWPLRKEEKHLLH